MENSLKRLLDAGTAVVADVFDQIGKMPLVLDNHLFPIPKDGVKFIGPSYTILGEFQSWTGDADHAKFTAIDEIPPAAVAVWAGNDMKGVCCFGDLLAEAMKARGCAGVIVDGGIRDLAYLRELGLPMMVRYCTPASSLHRWFVVDRQVDVKVRGALADWVTIHPGDIIVADDDGVIVVPEDLVDLTSSRALEWSSKDSTARKALRDGNSLSKAYEKYGQL